MCVLSWWRQVGRRTKKSWTKLCCCFSLPLIPFGARHPHDENSPTLYRAISSFIHKQQRHDVVTLRLSGDRKAFSVSRFLDLASSVFVHTSHGADEGGSQHESSDRVNSLAWCDAEWEIHHRFFYYVAQLELYALLISIQRFLSVFFFFWPTLITSRWFNQSSFHSHWDYRDIENEISLFVFDQ